MVLKELVTFHLIIKNIMLDIYILCNEALIHTYVFRYVSNVFRINLIKFNNIVKYIIKMIYITCDTSIAHYST